MKLLQELNEWAAVQPVLQRVGQECTEFLSDPFELYRGIETDIGIHRLKIRQDREPLDSDYMSSGLFNYLFEKQTGVKNIRMRVMFCTADRRQASRYGTVYWVFPVNGSDIWASPGIHDSRGIIDNTLQKASTAIHDTDIRNAISNSGCEPFDGGFFQFIEQHGSRHAQMTLEKIAADTRVIFAKYQKVNVAQIQSLPADTEIMVVGPAYYAANISWVSEQLGIPYEDMAFKQLIKATKKTAP